MSEEIKIEPMPIIDLDVQSAEALGEMLTSGHYITPMRVMTRAEFAELYPEGGI